MLYQSGYLTVKKYDRDFNSYIVGFPNNEVEHGFLNALLPSITQLPDANTSFDARKFVRDLNAGDTDSFLTRLKSLYASIPYGQDRQNEHYYQSIFYVIFALMGQYTKVEEHTYKGRSDAVVETNDAIYVFEFKLTNEAGNSCNSVAANTDDLLATAICQIEKSGYADAYAASSKQLHKIAILFGTEFRNIIDWLVVS